MTTTITHTVKTLDARRAHGEALIQQADAQQAQRLAAAEAQAAQQEVARRQDQARHAELSAQLDALDTWAAQQREQEYREWRQEQDRREQMMEDLRGLATSKPAPVRMSRDEQVALRAHLDAEVERDDQARAAREEQERREAIDRDYRKRQARFLGMLRDEMQRQEREV